MPNNMRLFLLTLCAGYCSTSRQITSTAAFVVTSSTTSRPSQITSLITIPASSRKSSRIIRKSSPSFVLLQSHRLRLSHFFGRGNTDSGPSNSSDVAPSKQQQYQTVNDMLEILTSEEGQSHETTDELCFDPLCFEQQPPNLALEENSIPIVEAEEVLMDDCMKVIFTHDELIDDEICLIYDELPTPQFTLPNIKGEDGEDDSTPPQRGIILIDNFSPYHGNYIAKMALEAYNAGVVSVLSPYVTGYLYQERGMIEHLSQRAPELNQEEKWATQIPFEVVGILCESDSGLETAERLGVALGLYPDRADGVNEARRDKFIMNDVVREAGLGVVKQRMCESVEEALEFAVSLGVEEYQSEGNDLQLSLTDLGEKERNEIVSEGNVNELDNGNNSDNLIHEDDFDPSMNAHNEKENGQNTMEPIDDSDIHNNGAIRSPSTTLTPRVILKPRRGVASDNVYLCTNPAEIEEAFTKIQNSSVIGTMTGEKHTAVLVQEFAVGIEYAVDIVSKAGHHKVAALWKYDKRSVNGAPLVYYATELVDADSEGGRLAVEYAMTSLDALGIHWGMSNTEVMVNGKEDTKLIEVNCRQHNTNFGPLAQACVGYNALDMVLASYLGDGEDMTDINEHKRLDWDSIPDLPTTQSYGAIVHLICFSDGILKKVQHTEEIEGMESVLAMEIYPHFQVGERITPTVDIRTDAGSLHMMNIDQEQFQRDYARIIELMPTMFLAEEENEGGENVAHDEQDDGHQILVEEIENASFE